MKKEAESAAVLAPASAVVVKLAAKPTGAAWTELAAKAVAEEALKNAKGDIDIAMAQSELAVMAAQISALRKYRQKR